MSLMDVGPRDELSGAREQLVEVRGPSASNSLAFVGRDKLDAHPGGEALVHSALRTFFASSIGDRTSIVEVT